MIWIKKQLDNPEVTNFYLEVIRDAYRKKGEKVVFFTAWDECDISKKDVVVVSNHREALKMVIERKRFVYWVQGIVPEEDYAKFKKKWRKVALEVIEYITLKKAEFVFYVSNRMRKHYEQKYRIISKNYYIMPCNNDVIHKDSFFGENKYKKKVFCYAGGLDVWQCFEQTIKLYKRFEMANQDARLLLLVKDRKLAERVLRKYDVKNYHIDYVPVSDLPRILSQVKFGFLIREDIELNRVATPTKLMTYVGNGVIPILSDCLEGLMENLDCTNFYISVGSNYEIKSNHILTEEINKNEIYNQFQDVYNKHYNRDNHIENLVGILP